MNPSGKADIDPLFKATYEPEVDLYPIEIPANKSASDFYFTTDSGLKYQVMFARKRDSYLAHIVNFSVLNEEFEDEYSETNRGEVYRIIATVAEIISIYHKIHPSSRSYEFAGEFKDGNEHGESSIRTRLYFRKAKRIMHPSWMVSMLGNKVLLLKDSSRA